MNPAGRIRNDIHSDDVLGAHLPASADRHHVDQSSVDQVSSTHVDWREDTGDRDAGSNGRDHRAGANHHLLAMNDVCRHAGKGNLQVGESQISQEGLER